MKFNIGDRVYVHRINAKYSSEIQEYLGKIGTIVDIHGEEKIPYVCQIDGMEDPYDKVSFFGRELKKIVADTEIARKLYPDAVEVEGGLAV